MHSLDGVLVESFINQAIPTESPPIQQSRLQQSGYVSSMFDITSMVALMEQAIAQPRVNVSLVDYVQIRK